ncbi:hypothetical protein [Streptomyces sp. 891-h]|uniref:hypothetical protein n=1 Tax=Streptomyces sp. 891-h TaxID=2720714 RepID=UPI001FAB0EC0|nr:hypothetical protein [Streptomyces sp. 891-h]UNZ19562.1 hypothetical protein HC362_23525 [Streptomyces sp. 891-h]
MTTTSKAPYKGGDYVVDLDAAQPVPPEPSWAGPAQQTFSEGRVQLVTHTGYEWPADPQRLREATQQERDVYNAARRVFLKPLGRAEA